MTDLVEHTAGKIRDLPIAAKLRELLLRAAAEAGVDRVRVTSGGQCAKGTCSKRTGSTRHDLGMAADLELWQGDRALSFTSEADLPTFIQFVTRAARLGATGMGAGLGYMGPTRIHVGYGTRALWGATGSLPPSWLQEAAKAGWSSSDLLLPRSYEVIARDGLLLRSGPGTEFAARSSINFGAVVNVDQLEGPHREWARVDLQGDGLVDGHMHRSFLRPVDVLWGDPAESEADAIESTRD